MGDDHGQQAQRGWCSTQSKFRVLDEHELKERQQEAVRSVTSVLSVPEADASRVLRLFKWYYATTSCALTGDTFSVTGTATASTRSGSTTWRASSSAPALQLTARHQPAAVTSSAESALTALQSMTCAPHLVATTFAKTAGAATSALPSATGPPFSTCAVPSQTASDRYAIVCFGCRHLL